MEPPKRIKRETVKCAECAWWVGGPQGTTAKTGLNHLICVCSVCLITVSFVYFVLPLNHWPIHLLFIVKQSITTVSKVGGGVQMSCYQISSMSILIVDIKMYRQTVLTDITLSALRFKRSVLIQQKVPFGSSFSHLVNLNILYCFMYSLPRLFDLI